jgi:microcystin-dependent protein
MAVNLSPIGNGFQFFTTTGLPLNGGYLYTYQAGSTTPTTTYTDNGGTIANTNPIQLGTDGRPPAEIWLTYGFNYKFVLADSTNAVIQTYDNLYGIIGVQSTSGATIPAGLISLWSGSIGSIPSGWNLCDGSNGTPNLTDRFIVGAGSAYAVNGTGGASAVTLITGNLPSHTHTATSVVTDPGHFHISGVPSDYSAGFGSSTIGSTNQKAGTGTTTSSPNTNTVTTGITVATTNASVGSGTSFSILNPYYALAYIMKL